MIETGFLLEVLQTQTADCRRCRLAETRNRVVFGEGDANANIMFIGEAPGQSEDEQGRPFVGRAGQMLNKWFAEAGLSRESVYIANICKCRPPNNRNPESDEVEACVGYLRQQIDLISPKALVLLGGVALKALTQNPKASIMKSRGQWIEFSGVPTMPTFHPAFVLRQPTKTNLDLVRGDIGKVVERVSGISGQK